MEEGNKDLSNLVAPGLNATLRAYQKDAVTWMLCREGITATGEELIDVDKEDELHVLWRKLPINSCEMAAEPLYFNPYTSRLVAVILHAHTRVTSS